MDFHEMVMLLTGIDDKLDEIRKLSKNQITDFRNAPFNNDSSLIEHILDEFIERQKTLNDKKKTIEINENEAMILVDAIRTQNRSGHLPEEYQRTKDMLLFKILN